MAATLITNNSDHSGGCCCNFHRSRHWPVVPTEGGGGGLGWVTWGGDFF